MSRARIAGFVQCCSPSYSTPTCHRDSPYRSGRRSCRRDRRPRSGSGSGLRPASVSTRRVRDSCGDSAPTSASRPHRAVGRFPGTHDGVRRAAFDGGQLEIGGLQERIEPDHRGGAVRTPAEVEGRPCGCGHRHTIEMQSSSSDERVSLCSTMPSVVCDCCGTARQAVRGRSTSTRAGPLRRGRRQLPVAPTTTRRRVPCRLGVSSASFGT